MSNMHEALSSVLVLSAGEGQEEEFTLQNLTSTKNEQMRANDTPFYRTDMLWGFPSPPKINFTWTS